MKRQIRLVLIDDDQGVLKALAMLLGALSYHVDAFSSAEEALCFIAGPNKVDIVVSDLRMPHVSGEDVVRRIRTVGNTTPIIIMSGHATPTDIDRLRKLGMSAFLAKPFTPDSFSRAVAELVPVGGKQAAA